jgi:molybdopterin converting factor small subunit
MSNKIRFKFVNCAADSSIQEIVAQEGTTINEFLSKHLGPSANLDRVLVRVNRIRQPMDYTLSNGDRVTMSPTDVSGA